MAKVGASIGLTMEIEGKNGEKSYIKPEVTIEDIDTNLPFDEQINVAIPIAGKVMDAATEVLKTKLNEILAEEYSELESEVGVHMERFQKYLNELNQRLIALEEKR